LKCFIIFAYLKRNMVQAFCHFGQTAYFKSNMYCRIWGIMVLVFHPWITLKLCWIYVLKAWWLICVTLAKMFVLSLVRIFSGLHRTQLHNLSISIILSAISQFISLARFYYLIILISAIACQSSRKCSPPRNLHEGVYTCPS
jgi:hypothetical protein